jgi:hypothetical protein
MTKGDSVRVFLFIVLLQPVAAQSPLTQNEERGRQVFERGMSPAGQGITALISPGAAVSAAILPCSNCHGRDGLGRPEGGIVPSNITWDAITKPYDVKGPNGRTHPAYTERLLKRAITMGIDSGGTALNPAMPRYQLSLADASDLVAYLKKLGRVADAGVTATSVRVGVIVRAGMEGEILRQALSRHAAEVNGLGGIFSRRIELVYLDAPDDAARRSADLRDFLQREAVFAVCGDFTGAERETAEALRDSGVPAIAVFAASPDVRPPLNPYVFYLDDGSHPSPDRARSAWDRATASAEILCEAMKRAGRSLTRYTLIEALESLYQVETSLRTPISFGPNRRIGAGDGRK